MLFVLSPAKTMRIQPTTEHDVPYFEQKANVIINCLKQLDQDQLTKMMKLSTKQYDEVKQMLESFGKIKTKAMDAYYGLVMKHAHLDELNDEQLAYFQKHVCFLSAVYGLLKANDGISSYRLEAKSKLNGKVMYEYWENEIAELCKDDFIINLASKEYEPFLKPYLNKQQWVDVLFYVRKDGKLKTLATYAKMARGEFIHYACCKQANTVEDLKHFHALDFNYDELLSNDKCLVYVKEE